MDGAWYCKIPTSRKIGIRQKNKRQFEAIIEGYMQQVLGYIGCRMHEILTKKEYISPYKQDPTISVKTVSKDYMWERVG